MSGAVQRLAWIAAGADIASISRQLGHVNVVITLSTYSHWFAKRSGTGLGATLEGFLNREREAGGGLVVVSARKRRQIVDFELGA